MQQIAEKQKYFCYFYIRALGPAIYGFIQIIIGFILFLMSVAQYKQTIRVTSISRNLKLIYISLFGQCIFYLIRMSFLETLYWMFRSQPHLTSQSHRMSILSRDTFVVDIFSIFCIQAMLILVCYNWMVKTIDVLGRLSDIQSFSQETSRRTNQFLKFQRVCSVTIKFYMIIRCFLYCMCILYVLFAPENPQGSYFKMYLISYAEYQAICQHQSIFVPILLAIGIYAIKRNDKIAEIVGWEEIQIMINQYIILILCTVVRFSFGLIEVIKGINDTLNQKQSCYIELQPNDKTLNKQITIVVQYLFQDLLSYFIPIFMVLRIFRVRIRDTEISASLLQLDPNNPNYVSKANKSSTSSSGNITQSTF